MFCWFLYISSAPSRAPDLVTAYNTSSTSLVVKWSHVPKQYFQGNPIGYKLRYYPVDLKRNAISFIVNYTTNTAALKNLTVYTVYVINVSAVSSGGVGPGNMTITRTDAKGTEVFKVVTNFRFNANDKIKSCVKESSARGWSQIVDRL